MVKIVLNAVVMQHQQVRISLLDQTDFLIRKEVSIDQTSVVGVFRFVENISFILRRKENKVV